MELPIEREAVGLLAECVRVNTVNPSGGEAGLPDLLVRHLRAADVPAEVQPLTPGRTNLLARLPGRGKRPALVLGGHTDSARPIR